jgi:hypothetical protein
MDCEMGFEACNSTEGSTAVRALQIGGLVGSRIVKHQVLLHVERGRAFRTAEATILQVTLLVLLQFLNFREFLATHLAPERTLWIAKLFYPFFSFQQINLSKCT